MAAKISRIAWGATFTNSLTLGYPIDNIVTWSQPREGSEYVRSPAGGEDAWDEGTDYYLAGDVRWIPTSDTTTPAAKGWDGADGWRAFLEWARQKNAIRFYADTVGAPTTYITSYLAEPMSGPPDIESDGTRKLRLVIRNTSTDYSGF